MTNGTDDDDRGRVKDRVKAVVLAVALVFALTVAMVIVSGLIRRADGLAALIV